MAKQNAITWISKEAKKLRKEYPHRFKTWREYVAQASAIYSSKHKGKSPIGKKKPVKRKVMGTRKRTVARVAKRPTIRKRSRRKVGESGVSTKSRTHTDYNRNKVNITVGAVNKHKKAAKEKLLILIGREEVKKFKATRKPAKRKIAKKITCLKSDYRRLSI